MSWYCYNCVCKKHASSADFKEDGCILCDVEAKLGDALLENETLRSAIASMPQWESEQVAALQSRLDSIRAALHLPADATHESVLNAIAARQGEYNRIVERGSTVEQCDERDQGGDRCILPTGHSESHRSE